MKCDCRRRPADGEVIYVVLSWTSDVCGHRVGRYHRTEHRPRPMKCPHVEAQVYGDMDAAINLDRLCNLRVTVVDF